MKKGGINWEKKKKVRAIKGENVYNRVDGLAGVESGLLLQALT